MHFVIAGGGIAALSCIERLLQLCEQAREGAEAALAAALRITIVSPSPVLKRAAHVEAVSASRVRFDVQSARAAPLLTELTAATDVDVHFVLAAVTAVDPSACTVQLRPASASESSASPPPLSLRYDRLLLATGASPARPFGPSPRVHVLRDTESIAQLLAALRRALSEDGPGGERGRVLVLGNGGIALEVVHALATAPLLRHQRERVVWVVKDAFMGNTFLDRAASAFLLPDLFPHSDPPYDERLHGDEDERRHRTGAVDRERRTAEEAELPKPKEARAAPSTYGGALGPHWQNAFALGGEATAPAPADAATSEERPIVVHFNTVVAACEPSPSPPATSAASSAPPLLRVALSNGQSYAVSLLLSATGVVPNNRCASAALQLHPEDGAIAVSSSLRASAPRVYAAGDCASVDTARSPHSRHWRLWNAARITGAHAATAMWEDALAGRHEGDVSESWRRDDRRFFTPLFVHETAVLGRRLTLMGAFNEEQWRWKQNERRLRRLRAASTQQSEQNDEDEDEGEDEDELEEEGDAPLRVLMRVRPGEEFVSVVMAGGRVQGCTLIGDTGLEEVMENLIVSALDLRAFGDDWLAADVDLQDFFD